MELATLVTIDGVRGSSISADPLLICTQSGQLGYKEQQVILSWDISNIHAVLLTMGIASASRWAHTTPMLWFSVRMRPLAVKAI